jgi:hypothetical protein
MPGAGRVRRQLANISRRNPDAKSSRVDRDAEGRHEGDRLAVDSGRDGLVGHDAQ